MNEQNPYRGNDSRQMFCGLFMPDEDDTLVLFRYCNAS
jgi:hypothetical protein